MNITLPSIARSFLLTIGLLLSFSFFYGNISAQTYFVLTEIEVIPINPDDQTPVSIRISGLRTNPCSFLNTSSLNINASFTVLNMDWDNQADTDATANCPNFSVPWDTTFQLGILNGGTNALYFAGNNYGLSGVNNPTVIQVAASACDNGNTEISVTNTNDEGPGSLRQAIVCANAQPGFNRIVFNLISEGPDTIRVGETSGFELPSIFDDSTFIDATTHPAFGNNGDFSPKVVLDGQYHIWDAAINALFVRADHCLIYGLEIINFPDDAIDVLAGDDVIIGGINRGNVIHSNGLDQDFFASNPGQGPWEGCGIVIRGGADRAIIRGNYIGTNFTETTPNGNEFCGILIRDSGDLHQIGGTTPGMGNVVVNNAIGLIIGGGTNGTSILQNRFYCNDSLALRISNTANNGIIPPVITLTEYGNIGGTAPPNQSVAVYRNDNNTCTTAPCQGGTYLGTASVVNGSWSLSEPFIDGITLNTGDRVTAIATDLTGNSSEFADCAVFLACTLALTVDNVEPTSCSAENGVANLSVSGGTPPYVFSYNGETSNNSNLINLGAGNYSVIVTDGNNCTAINNFTILENEPPVLSVDLQNNATCNSVNGSFKISIAGGQAPLTYTINGMATELLEFDNLSAGIYEIVVTDAEGCSDFTTITLTDSSPPVLAVVELDMATCGQNNGAANLAVSDGTAPYIFSYNNQNFNNPNFINLSAGDYSVTVTDVNSCTAETSFTIIANSAPELFVLSKKDAVCNSANGSFTLSVNEGAAPFIYTFNGATSGSPVFNNLFSGTYGVTVTDADGCTDSITVTLADSNPPIIAISQLNRATCGDSNGSLVVVAGGGTAPFVYSIDGVEQNNGNFNNLAEGIYSIGIRDGNACTAQLNAVIGDTPPVAIVAADIINPVCGNENGQFSVNVTGGSTPFSYTLNGSPTNQISFANLGVGTYTVVATDAVGCTEVVTVTLVDSGLLEIMITQQTDDTCNDGTGGFSLDVTGGQAPFEFDLGTGRINTGDFTDLSEGNYSVTVTDVNSCSAVVEVVLENNGTEPLSTFTFELLDGQVMAQSTAVGVTSLEWDFGDGGSSTAANIVHDYPGAGVYSLCLTVMNDCGSVTTCEDLEIVLPLSDHNIEGNINRMDGSGIGQVEVACTDQSVLTTGAAGTYLFENLPQEGNYEITPTKDINHRNGVTVLDIIKIRAHLLFIDTLETPYEYIAADVNRSGGVTVFDLVLLQQMVLESVDRFPQSSWDFLPADYTFDYGSQALKYTYPQSIMVNNLNTDVENIDFIGVKIGDLNESNNPSLLSNGYTSWQIADRSVAAGEIIEIPVRMLLGQELLGYEAALNFDPTNLSLQAVTGVTDYQVKDGQLKMLWYTEAAQNQAVSVTSATDLVTLRFLAHTDLEKISDAINFATADARQSAYDAQQIERSIQWSFTDAIITSTNIKNLNQTAPKLYPNPFQQQTFLTFELSQGASVSLEVYDLTGRAILQEEKMWMEGNHKITISGSRFSAAGTYFYRLKIGDQIYRGRIIKQ